MSQTMIVTRFNSNGDPAMERVSTQWWYVFIGCITLFLAVMAVTICVYAEKEMRYRRRVRHAEPTPASTAAAEPVELPPPRHRSLFSLQPAWLSRWLSRRRPQPGTNIDLPEIRVTEPDQRRGRFHIEDVERGA